MMQIPLRVYGWNVEEADYELVNIRLKIGYSAPLFPEVGLNVQSLNNWAGGRSQQADEQISAK